jgi:hypothetical protein
MSVIDSQIDRAMLEVNALSNIAKSEGDYPTMYAANRAWHSLFDAQSDRKDRRGALAHTHKADQ